MKTLVSSLTALALLALLTVPAFGRGIGAVDGLPICDAVRNGMAATSLVAMAGYVGFRYRLRRG